MFRHQALAWVLLASALAAAVGLGLPRLRFEFGFRDIFAAGHPARLRYEEHQWDFDLGQQIQVLLTGPAVFRGPFLKAVGALSAALEHVDGVRRVYSAVDLRAPEARGGHVLLTRILTDQVVEDPARLEQALASPPFRDRWQGLLYDERLETYVLLVTPSIEDGDPKRTLAFVRRIEALIREHMEPLEVEVHLGGTFYVSSELLRVTTENQRRLTSVIVLLQLVVMALLFGSLAVSLAALFLLAVSVVLGFGLMGLLGIPINFLSGNLPIMVMVLGTADLIHLIGFHAWYRDRYSGRGAALRAARATLLPNLLTSLTTAGCLLFTAVTDLNVLGQFSRALMLGVVLVYLVTIAFGPLLLAPLRVDRERGLYFRLLKFTRARRPPRRAGALGLFGALTLVAGCFAAMQEVNANWFRNFAPGLPVSRTLDVLRARRLPVTTLDLTLPCDQVVEDLLQDEGVRGDFARLRAALEALPGVLRVYSLFDYRDFMDQRFASLRFPAGLAPHWIEARREALARQYLAMGVLDPWYSRRSPRTRLVVATEVEDSRGLLRLEDQVMRTLRALRLGSVDPTRFQLSGAALYWGQVMDAIAGTFLGAITGSVLVILLGLWLAAGELELALLALLPNLLPLVCVFATATLMGYPLNEAMCVVISVSIGIAVDDTLHFLHHFRAARRRGASADAAADHALEVVAAPIVVTSLMLMLGYAVCLAADTISIRNTGVSMNVSVGVALLADLFLLPALLTRRERP